MARQGKHRAAPWFAFAVIAAIVLVCVIAVVGTRRLVEDRLRDDARFRLELASDLAEVAAHESVERLTAAAVTLSRDSRVVEAIRSNDRQALDDSARAIQQATEGAKVAFVVSPDATVLGMHPVDEAVIGDRFEDRDWYRGVQRRSPYLSEVYEMAAFDQARAVSIAAEVVDASGARVGFVTVAVETDYLGESLTRASRLEGAPALTLRDQRGAVISRSDRTPEAGRGFDERRVVRDTGWTLEAHISERRALADLPDFRRVTTGFMVLVCGLLLVLAMALYATARRLASARRDAERQEQAFELNDSVVQRMVVAHVALTMGLYDEARDALESALDSGRHIIATLADDRTSYVRDAAAATEDHSGSTSASSDATHDTTTAP